MARHGHLNCRQGQRCAVRAAIVAKASRSLYCPLNADEDAAARRPYLLNGSVKMLSFTQGTGASGVDAGLGLR